MNRIKVRVKKLGRVVDSDIEIAPLMIFSGESGMGKSYLALLAHYFYEVLIMSQNPRLPRLFDYLKYDYKEMAKTFHVEGEAFTITKKEIEKWMEEDAINYLRFMLNSDELEGKIEVTLPNTIPDSIVFKYREELTGLINSEDVDIILSINDIGYRANHSAINDTTPYAALLSAFLIECLFGNMNALTSTFNMPPSRGPVLSENVLANSGMYKDFISDINQLSNVQSNPQTSSMPLLNQLYTIMEGEIKKENNRFMYYKKEAFRPIPISAAASSIREIAPLQILASKWDIKTTAVLIEEPEAHLHPDKQRMMADIVGCIVKYGAHVHLTTHSDYFLRRINELIMFQKYANSHTQDETALLMNKTGISTTFSIDEKDMMAYLVVRQENGSSVVVSQNMKYGVPFTSFSSAIKESMRINDILEEALGI